ncbi:carbamate kinase [Methanolacinia petrolearia DSM 11571]|uniref:Carbamate kinase n=1 Tax=Methanolacinia petrolearia (strain DSM 11571 / OCM 486 / SEBR 4847) TaxID=679926 RepID=E1REL6_METP4|nr:carbamate kinase [Methanolacinia petrolearia]ADN34963.1 carbamate kinase [Methanolacinia petrolearia DSM 11571]
MKERTVLVALGGNALLKRGESPDPAVQRENVRRAAEALAPLAKEYKLVLTHGNGPQVGLLALQAAAYTKSKPYPLDILGAETEGMIGYLIEQELRNILPPDVPVATMLTMTAVDPSDTAFENPEKFVGPVYTKEQAGEVGNATGWTFRQDGFDWRRVVPSPEPVKILEMKPIRWLIEKGAIVICTGGGGIPVVPSPGGGYSGIEAVIDKDLASAILAEELRADLFIMATDVEGVYLNWKEEDRELIGETTPRFLGENRHHFPPGSMGPKVDAACRFVEATGNPAAIGSLEEIAEIAAGSAGTIVRRESETR